MCDSKVLAAFPWCCEFESGPFRMAYIILSFPVIVVPVWTLCQEKHGRYDELSIGTVMNEKSFVIYCTHTNWCTNPTFRYYCCLSFILLYSAWQFDAIVPFQRGAQAVT